MIAECETAPATRPTVPAPAAHVTPDPQWDRNAASFGCDLKVHAELRANGTQYVMYYASRNATRDRHHRLFTTTLFRIPKDASAAHTRSEAIIGFTAMSALETGAQIREFRRFSVAGRPCAFYDYVANGVRSIGIISPAGLGMLAVQQLVIGGDEALTPGDRSHLRELAGI